MGLESRLARLQKQAGRTPSAAKPSVSALRKRITQLESRGRVGAAAPPTGASGRAGSEDLAKRLGGELSGDGLIVIHQRCPLQGRLGSIELATLPPQPRLPGETDRAQRYVYIDTETTGLSGGSGTLAFLIGLAVFADDAIELTQFLITGFAAEAAALSGFARRLQNGDRLVSYNGKSYDLPLLTGRFRMQALQPSFATLPHLDLLHPVRRLFGRRWPDCRLTRVEQRLLGFRRTDDLPGSEAPEAWFRWLRQQQPDNLARVVEHNRQDIVSLALAHRVLGQAIEHPHDFGLDVHGLARWLGEHDDRAALALLRDSESQLCEDGLRLLARLERRAGNWPKAAVLWKRLAATGCSHSLERLAIYHEHVSRDLEAARHCCCALPPGEARQHRLQRLERKLENLGSRHHLHSHAAENGYTCYKQPGDTLSCAVATTSSQMPKP